jgi:hypothetical protein
MDSPIARETVSGARVVRGERREFHEGNVWESTTEDVSVRGKLLQVSHPLKSRQLQHRSSQPVQLPITAGLLEGLAGAGAEARHKGTYSGRTLG